MNSSVKPVLPALRFDAGGLSPLEQDNAYLYAYEQRKLAHERARRETQLAREWEQRQAQIEDWADAQKDALEEALAVAHTLPCSLNQARQWQADETEEGRTRWAAYLQEVKTARLIDAPPPLTVVNAPGEFTGEGDDEPDTGAMTARQEALMAVLFLLAGLLGRWTMGGLGGDVFAVLGVLGAVVFGFSAWAASAANAALDEEDDEAAA